MTPNDIIEDARRLAQDNGLLRVSDTYTAAALLAFVNQTIRQVALIRPDLFAVITNIPTTANVVEQSMPSDSMRLMNIFGVKDGSGVVEVDRQTMDRAYPQWRTDTAGTPVNYMRHAQNPNKYFLYPRPTAGTELVAEYAQTPPIYTLSATINLLPDSYQPVIVSGVVMLIAGIENNTIDPNRYKQFEDSFRQALDTNFQSRVVTDVKSSGFDPKQVI